jgi:hypothetical protein
MAMFLSLALDVFAPLHLSRTFLTRSKALSRGKKYAQSAHSEPNPHEWADFCPPLGSQWADFLEEPAHNSALNHKDLSESGQIGHIFPGDRALEVQNASKSGQVSSEKTTHSHQKTAHSPSAHPLVEGVQACSRCGMPMEETQPEGPAELKWQCSTCGWWLIHCK